MKQNSASTAKQNPKQTQSPALDPKQNSAGIAEVMGMSLIASFQQMGNGQPRPAHWLALQRTVGNRATQNLIQRSTFFDKLGSKDGSGEKGSTNHPTLQYGSQGSAVSTLQNLLNLAGAVPQLVVDGIFGPKTHNAVQGFQAQNQLTPDGIVGGQTWKALDSVSGMPSEDMTANEGETLDNGTPNQTHNLTDSSEDGGLLSAIGQKIPILNKFLPPLSWANLYSSNSEFCIGEIYFDTAESEPQSLDDVEAIRQLAEALYPHLVRAVDEDTEPIEIEFEGWTDYRPYSGDNDKLSHWRAVNVAAALNTALTGQFTNKTYDKLGYSHIDPNSLHEKYKPKTIGRGVDPMTLQSSATDEALARSRRVDIITYHKFSKFPGPAEPDPERLPQPGEIVTNDKLPKSKNWEARILSKVKIGTGWLGAENMELEFRDTENRLWMRFVYFGYLPKAGIFDMSPNPSEWVPFTTDEPMRILDFRGLSQHIAHHDVIDSSDKVIMDGPYLIGAAPTPIEVTFKSTTKKPKLSISASAGGMSDASFAKRY